MLHPSKVTAVEDNSAVRRLHLVAAGCASAGKREEVDLEDADRAGKLSSIAADLAPTLLGRARNGEPEAFQAIFTRYSKPVAAFLFHLIGDRSRIEELTQETFFRTFCGLNRIREGIRLSTWIFGIARNVAHEALRDVRRSRRHIGLDDGPHLTLQDDASGPDVNLAGYELRDAIRKSLMALSEDQRVVFILKLLYKMRYEEISAITGFSVGKLKTDLHRARQAMRARLQPYVGRKTQDL